MAKSGTCLRHIRNWLTLSSNIQAPTWVIRRLSSNNGMNSEGNTSPCSGEFHRSSASAPVTTPVTASTCGW